MAATKSPRMWRSLLRQYISGRPLHDVSTRTFATTASRRTNRTLPTFEPSSTPDLDTLLSLIRNRVLLTGALNEQQKDLVFSQKWKSTLENEPVYASIGTQEHQLHHLDRFTDMPNRWRSFRKALDMAKTDEDWRNMVKMLEGYHFITKNAGVPQDHLEKFVRRAKGANQIAKILQCLWGVKDTGLSLSDPAIAHQAFVGCISDQLRVHDYTDRQVKIAWKRVKDLLQMMEMPEHCGGKVKDEDVRQQPWVLGVVVEAAALYEKMRWAEEDARKEETTKYVGRLLDCVEKTPLNTLLLEVEETGNASLLSGQRAKVVAKLLPLWHGLGVAEELLGPKYERAAAVAKLKNATAQFTEDLINEIESSKKPDKVYLPVEAWKVMQKEE